MYNQTDINQIVDNFNNTALELGQQLSVICPNSLIGSNISFLNSVINDRETKTKIIELFVLNVLKYKQKIDEGDEQFFINNSFAEEVAGDNYLVKKLFEFKTIWGTLKTENKKLVIEYMQILCYFAQEYFLAKYGDE